MNRLANETSPYLLQHASNPVDWYPWGEEALSRAQAEDKPILLSIGYSACHWCHVMERESFENDGIAAIMNAYFVCIKVDREERPDLDDIYMKAVQAMTGSGGWPMTVFCTPDGRPFYGGTYYPPEDRHGLPAFSNVLRAVADAYDGRREDMLANADKVRDHLQERFQAEPTSRDALSRDVWDQAVRGLRRQIDGEHGGFGGAPKFPQAMALNALLRDVAYQAHPASEQALRLTLDQMARGGIYDQLGGGFHRYAVDDHWLVPHFEKMLYDNALLSALYLQAYQVWGDARYRRIVEETLDYVQRQMTAPTGGFYATEDADSEGEEGRFYIWTREQVLARLGEADGAVISRYYGLDAGPNFEGRNILHVREEPVEVAESLGLSPEALQAIVTRAKPILLAARAERVRPGRDEKSLAAWNGLMLRSYARAGAVLGRPDYLRTAERNAQFLMRQLWDGQRLHRTYKDGQARLNGYLEDYAAVGNGLLDLWEATFELRWFQAAQRLAREILARFRDTEGPGFYDTSADHERLVVRPRNVQDNATPCGSSLAAELLQRLAMLTADPDLARAAQDAVRPMIGAMTRYPQAFGQWLGVLDRLLGPQREIAIVGDLQDEATQALLAEVHARYLPKSVVACAPPDSPAQDAIALLQDRPQRGGQATAYVCQNHVCQQPVTDPSALASALV